VVGEKRTKTFDGIYQLLGTKLSRKEHATLLDSNGLDIRGEVQNYTFYHRTQLPKVKEVLRRIDNDKVVEPYNILPPSQIIREKTQFLFSNYMRKKPTLLFSMNYFYIFS
jgi:hypothetical protein